MLQKNKGSRPQDKIVGISQAARMLRVTERVIRSLCQRGVLTPVRQEGKRGKFFSASEIASVAEVLHAKTSLSDLAAIAMQAHVRSKAAERRLDEIFYLMGWYRVPISLTEEEIVLLHTAAEDALESPPTKAEEIRWWAEKFFGMDEGYFSLVGKHTASNEPWKLFMDLAQKLSSEAPRSSFSGDPPLHFAYAYLEASREHLRNAAYLYCRHHLGARLANEVFRDGKISPTERIIQLLYPH
jgi:DNA-binding transcriptional MerR regulator